MPTYILYHANCSDGLWAAWACWRKFGDDATYLPVSYQEPLPEIPDGSEVWIVDFSYPRTVLQDLLHGCDLMVIDHHKTAMQELSTFSRAIFDMDKCGAVLTWETLFPFEEVPEVLLYVQDRDLWQHKKPFTHQVYNAMREVCKDINACNVLYECWNLTALVQAGQPLFEERQAEVRAKALSHAWAKIGGYVIPVAEAHRYYSDVANLLCHLYPEYPFAACHRFQDGKKKWDLRSVGEFDVSAIAKQYGGGGHLNASGFSEGDEAIEVSYRRMS